MVGSWAALGVKTAGLFLGMEWERPGVVTMAAELAWITVASTAYSCIDRSAGLAFPAWWPPRPSVYPASSLK